MTAPEPLIHVRALCGEGPIWDASARALWWIDIDGRAVHRRDAAGDRTWAMPTEPGTVVPRRAGGALVALRDGLHALTDDGGLTALGAPHEHGPGFRFNDGKCDAAGRLWVGTLADDGDAPARCHLYRWDGTRLARMVERVGLSNGIGWSPDGRTLWYIDTPTRRVDAFAFDPVRGELGARRTAVRLPEDIGWPDGLAVDAEGTLWIGMWGGWRVQRCDPATGRLHEHLPLPVAQVTACAFGGDDGRDLFITTAARGQDPLRQPLAGHVFRCRPGPAGPPGHAAI